MTFKTFPDNDNRVLGNEKILFVLSPDSEIDIFIAESSEILLAKRHSRQYIFGDCLGDIIDK